MKSIKQDKKKLLKCALLLALIFTLLFAATATAQARIVVNPRPMNFGGQTVGVASASMTVTLTNNSLSNIKIVGVSLSSIQFSYSGDPLPIILRPGQSLIGAVSVTPAAAQAYLETLTFTRANGMTVTDSLSAFGIALAQSPSITTQPLSQTIIAGQTATFSVAAAGTAPLSYQWQKNGAAMSGATSSSYTTPAETTADNSAAFSVVVTNSVGSVTSSAAVLTVNPAPVPPSITAQPLSQTIIAGQTATFSVTASGTAPLSYQWQKNGAAISGVTSSSYTTPAETIADNAAAFSVAVTNSVGSVTSSAAILTVNAPPVAPSITTQPLSQTIIAGQTATFSVTAAGTAPLNYQWQKNGAAMSGATSSSYTTPAETIADNAAQFSIVVSNSVGSVTSSVAILTVNAPPVAPSITTQPLSQTIIAGQTATFSVTAAGTAPLSYQWQKNATATSGAIAASYTTPAETIADNGAQFAIVVTNSVGSVTSSAAILTVNAPPVTPSITTQPLSQTITAGMTAMFSVTAAGTAPLSYQWRKNATAISGATSSSYTTPAETIADNGAQFAIVVTNSVGSVTSSAAILTVNAVPPGALTASTSALSFGNVNIGSNRVLGMTFTNSGSSNITISNVTISGPGFISTGVSAGLILTPGQIGTLSVTFTPAATGSVAGSVSVASNASNSPGLVALSGTGVQVISHSATLNWTASASTVIGYNLYRATISGGPYTKINSSIDATTTFTDAGIVQAGKTYYWVVTAVNSSNVESVQSGEVSATIPTP
jgi:hypothetical protein